MLPIKHKVFRQVDVVSSVCVCVCVGEGAQASVSTSRSCDARLSGHVRLSICIVSIYLDHGSIVDHRGSDLYTIKFTEDSI